MSLLRPATERRAVTLEELVGNLDRMPVNTWAGIPITPRTALANPAVWRSRQLICGLISGFPVGAYRKVGKIRVEVDPTPPILTAPSGQVTRRSWVWQAMESLLFDGNIVGRVLARDRLGHPSQVELVDMACVSVMKDRSNAWQWRIEGRQVSVDDIWHVANDPPPGHILGRSLLEHAKDVIAVGLGAQRYAGEYFHNGAHPSMVLRNTLTELNKTQAMKAKQRVMNAMRSVTGRREPLVIGKGWELSEWQSTPSDAALVEVWASNVTNVVNYFGVPAELLGGKTSSSMTYTNLEARALDLLKFCIGIWMQPLEEGLTNSLPRPQFVKFNPDSLLRMDTISRYQSHERAIRGGFATPNERRELEDMEPVADGDRILWPPYSTSAPKAPTAAPAADPTEEGA